MYKSNPKKQKGIAHYWAIPTILLFIILSTISFAQNANNIFVAGATSATNTNSNVFADTYITQQVQNNSYAVSGIPDYCQTPANQNRSECQSQQTSPSNQPIGTQSNLAFPDYCQTPANQSRSECHGYIQVPNPIASIIPATPNRPQYCDSPQYQHLAECQIIFMTPPTPPIGIICSEPNNALTPLCQEYFANLPKPPIPTPAYCREQIYQSRPECMIQVFPNYPQPIYPQPITPPFCPPGIIDQFCIPQPRPCTGPYDPLCTPQYPPYIQPPFVPTPPYIPTPPTICDPNYPPINCIQPPRPCIDGIYDPLCNFVLPQPICPPNYMPAPPPTMCIPVPIISPPIPVPPLPPFDPDRKSPPPPTCPPGLNNLPDIDCIDRSDFALPFAPPNLECQNLQRYPSDPLTQHRVCSAIYFTHDGAYSTDGPIATVRPNQAISFSFQSPFNGYPYFFAKTTDGKLHQLYFHDASHFPTNTPPPPPPLSKIYDRISLPTTPNNNSFKVQGTVDKLFVIVLSKMMPSNTFINLSNESVLDRVLTNLGTYENIYHGYIEVPLIPTTY